MNHQPEWKTSSLYAVQSLRGRDARENETGLGLDDHLRVDQEIGSVEPDRYAAVKQLERDLFGDVNALIPQLDCQRPPVDSLKKSEAELVVNNEARRDEWSGEFLKWIPLDGKRPGRMPLVVAELIAHAATIHARDAGRIIISLQSERFERTAAGSMEICAICEI